jgi:protein-S-isoprenylcysteine O-methyltransferase Ste14
MTRYLQLLAGLLAYLLFLATFLYLIGFVGDLVVPRTIDAGPAAPLAVAVAVDVALIALFGVQHSVMARPGFKAAWTRVVPVAFERTAYVVASSLALIVLMALWRPIPASIWAVAGGGADVLWAVFALGWGVVLLSTFLINHFELFGLEQLWRQLRALPAAGPQFREPLFYRWVRHPLYFGFILAFWATPRMTVSHLLLALGMTIYILIAIRFEERDLLASIGAPYADYRRRVGMLFPGLGRAR